jgi:DNA repair protein RecN (Recombination protein N)
LRQELQQAHVHLRDVQERLEQLETRRREAEQRAERLRVQAEEIEKARLRAGEEQELEVEAYRLSHAEELARLAARLHEQLYAAEHAVASRIDELRRTLSQLSKFDPSLSDRQRVLDDAYFAVQELGREMGEYAARIDADPQRLESIRLRQDQVYRLKTRYGVSVEELIEMGRRARAELALLADATMEHEALERELALARREFGRLCAVLSGQRREAATRLDAEMNAALPQLGLQGGLFVTALIAQPEASANGAESVEFRVTVNAGFEPGILRRVASGGELARIMLALKSILAHQDQVPTLVFDEIDAGIGGRAAYQVAERLRGVAAHHQVLVVTHLAQVASRADHHLLVDKRSEGARATVAMGRLEGEARVREIARLLGGDPDSHVSRAHARELLAAT